MYDYWGRRIFAILGGTFCFVFLVVVAEVGGTGTKVPTDPTAINAIIASVILVQFFGRFSITNAFVIGAEIGGVKMRRKVLATGGLVNMASAILVTSVVVSQAAPVYLFRLHRLTTSSRTSWTLIPAPPASVLA